MITRTVDRGRIAGIDTHTPDDHGPVVEPGQERVKGTFGQG
jgi:hypothetical protein